MPSDATRDSLLDAAKRVVQRDGAANLTLDAVAKEAGVSKGGLLYHFPSKLDLLRGMVAKGVGMQEAEMDAAIGPRPRRGDFARGFLRCAMTQPAPECRPPVESVWSMLGAAANDPSLLDPAKAMHERWKARLEADLDDPDMAALFRLVGHGLWSMELFGVPTPDAAQRERILERLRHLAGLDSMEER